MQTLMQNSRKLFGFLRFVAFRFSEDRCVQMTASDTVLNCNPVQSEIHIKGFS